MTDATRPSGWPITRLLSVLLVGLVLVAMMPVIGLAYYAAQSNYETSSRENNELLVDLIEQRLQAHLRPVHDQLGFVADAVARGTVDFDDPKQWHVFALGSLAAVPQARGLVVVPLDGEPSRFTRDERSVAPAQLGKMAFTAGLLDRGRTMQGPSWGEPTWSEVFGEPILPVVAPLRVRQQYRGVIAAAVGTSNLSLFLKGLELPGERTPFVLAGRDHVLAHPYLSKEQGIRERQGKGRLFKLDELKDPVLAAIWQPDANELVWFREGGTTQGHWNWVGDRSFGWIYRPLHEFAPAQLLVGFHVSGRESAWARWIVRGIGIAGIVLMLITAALAVLLGRRLAQPVLALADAAGAVERLELDRLPELGDAKVREINQANRAFERMARALKLSATYLPRALVARLTTLQGRLPASEDRPITVMFCDLEGYTAFSRGRPAAETAAYLNSLLARIGPAIEATGGTIDKYIGDGVMAFWGAPEPVADHARAACFGALAVMQEVEGFNAERRGRGVPTCRMRIGLHTGTVLVGNVGFAGRVDYTAIGEAVNVAARLEQFGRHASADGDVLIVVSASCRAAAKDGFRWVALADGPRDVAAESVLPLALLRGRQHAE